MVPGSNTLITELLSRSGFASFSAARGMRQADVSVALHRVMIIIDAALPARDLVPEILRRRGELLP